LVNRGTTGVSSLPKTVIAKFHYTDTDTDFFAVKLRWVRAGPFGSVSVSMSV